MPRLRSPESGPKSGGVWRKAWLFVNFFWSKKNIYKDGHFIKIYFLWQLPSPKALNKTVFICCFFKLSKYLQWKSKAKGKAKRLENPLTKVYIVEYWNKEVIPKKAQSFWESDMILRNSHLIRSGLQSAEEGHPKTEILIQLLTHWLPSQ